MATTPTLDQLTVAPARSRADQLADTLDARIQELSLQPGDRFSTLDEIRAETGLARTTVSEAVRLLRERGVLEIRPGRGGGIFVAETTPLVRIRRTLLAVEEAPASVREAVELREALEAPIALGAALNCGEAEAAQLREAGAAITAPGISYAEFLRRNWHLHEIIAGLHPNRMMSAVYTSCLGSLERSEPSFGAGGEDSAGGSRTDSTPADAAYIAARGEVHVELVEAILAGDTARILAAVHAHNDDADPTSPTQ